MPKVAPYSLKNWQALVEDALTRAKPRHDRWRLWEHLFRTGQANGGLTKASVPTRVYDELPALNLTAINLMLPHMSMIIASSVDRAPEFLVEPYGGDELAEAGAKAGEELLRYFWKRVSGTDIARDMVQDAVVIGNGFGKTGWAFEEEEKPEDVEAEELAALIESDRLEAQLQDRAPRSEDELASLIDSAQVVEDEPWFQYVSPYDIFVPATARRIDECRWIVQRVVMPLDEAKADERFDAEARETLQTSDKQDRAERREMDEDINEGGAGDDDPFAEVTLYEAYDMRARRMTIFQLNTDTPLYEGPLPHSHRYTPFVHLRNFEDGGSRFWSFGDLENVSSIQAQFNDYIDEQMANALRSGNKYAVDEQYWTSDLKNALESEMSDVVFKIALQGGDKITDAIQALPRQGLSPDVYQAKEDLRQAMEDVLGLNDFQTGGVGADRMSATAAAVVDGTATLRAADKRKQVEAAISRSGLLLLLLCQEFLDEPRAVRVVGDDGIVSWLKAGSEDLVGEYNVSVATGSTQAVNPATRQQRAVELMQNVIPALAADGYDTHPLWRRALRDYGLDPDRLLQKLPMPEEEPVEEGGGEVLPEGVPGSRADVMQPGAIAL